MIRAGAMLWLCCATVAAQPVQPRPSDFAWQLPLTVSGDNGVVQFRLPADVYVHAQNAHLADLRVFDPAGQPVPYALHRPALQTITTTRESAAQQFSIYADAAASDDDAVALQVRASSDGSLLAIEARSQRIEADAPLTALILDVGTATRDETLERLQLELPEGHPDYRATLLIEQSDDLQLWDALAHANVDWLRDESGDGRIVNDRIALSGATGRYLRVQWRAGKPLRFHRVNAYWRSATVIVDAPLQIVLDPQPGRQPGDWTYRTSPSIAATRMGLELPQPNTVLPVSIGSYREQPRLTPPWRFDAQIDATFYRLLRDGQERRSSLIATGPIAHAEWVVRSQRTNEAAPKLVLHWQPDTLVFNARGTGPYTLATGAAAQRMRDWTPGPTTLALVAPGYSDKELAELEHAQAGALAPAAAPESAVVAAQADPTGGEISRRTLLLWGVLGIGVLVLAGMSLRLFTQMERSKGEAE